MGLTGFNRARREIVQKTEAASAASSLDDSTRELLDKALELGLGDDKELESLTKEELEALISKALDLSKDDESKAEKAVLVEKLLKLKEQHPKAVQAPPSAITSMSVRTLLMKIQEAEAAIEQQG